MAYRSHREALEEQRLALSAELGEIDEQVRELEQKVERRKSVTLKLRDIESALAESARRLPLLSRARIASPCSARWEEMVGDDRVRLCGKCAKNVFDLTAIPEEEAEALIAKHGGN